MQGLTETEVRALRKIGVRDILKIERWLQEFEPDSPDAGTRLRYAYARGYTDAALKAYKQQKDG